MDILPQSSSSLSSLVEGIEWASSINVDVLVIPTGRMTDHPRLRQSIVRLALKKRTLVIAPVGNPFNGQSRPLYPAGYGEVLSVGCEAYLNLYHEWNTRPDVVTQDCEMRVCDESGWHLASGTSYAVMLVAAFACITDPVREHNDDCYSSKTSEKDLLLSTLPVIDSY
jgi:Subtilase family